MIGSLMMCVSVVILLIGMLAGIAMGITQNFVLAPAHAHLNLVGGVVGMGVDAVTGAALDHKPNPVEVTLQPTRPAAAPRPAKPPARKPAKPQPQS